MEFTPLAYVSQVASDSGDLNAPGERFEGYAAALVRQHGNGTRPGTILYIWGNLIDPDNQHPALRELAENLMRSALVFALEDVQVTDG
jgi:hypothetical protein